MSQGSKPTSNPPRTKMDNLSSLKESPSHLTLVVSNSAPDQGALAPSQTVFSNKGFMAEVQKNEINLYEMKIQDPFHDLGCDLTMEIEGESAETTVVCHFPPLLNESHKLLDEDETLYGIIMVQFQMNVLEQLLLFCATHNASQLTIYMDDDQVEGFGILEDFLIYSDETLTENGEKTEMIIPTDQESFSKWRNFMEKTNLTIEKDLWREQRSNPVIRHYLKSRAHS